MFLSNKPGAPPGINLLQKPNQKLSRPSGNLANPVIFSRKPGEDKDSTGSVTEGCEKLNSGIELSALSETELFMLLRKYCKPKIPL